MAFLSSFYPQPVVAGTTEGTYAEGDDPRIVGAAQKSANLSDLVSASSARANLDLEVGVDVAAFNDSRITGALPAATAGTGSVLAHSGATGATARTLAVRFADTINVKDFGATGNGSSNDQPAIQAAIDAAPNNSCIYFPRGTYLLSTGGNGLSVSKNLTFKGDGDGSVVLLDKSVFMAFRLLAGCSKAYFNNLCVSYQQGYHAVVNQFWGNQMGIFGESNNADAEVIIQDCRFENIVNVIYHFVAIAILEIRNCEIIAKHGFASCVWDNGVSNHPAQVILGAGDITIIDSVYFNGLVDPTMSNLVGNPPEKAQTALDGLYLNGGGNPRSIVISNCQCINYGVEGIFCTGTGIDHNYYANPSLNKSVTSLTSVASGNASFPSLATATVNNHGYVAGDTVIISGVTGANDQAYNGYKMIQTVTNNTFTYLTGTVASNTASGTIIANVNKSKFRRSSTVRNCYVKATPRKSSYYSGTVRGIVMDVAGEHIEVSNNTIVDAITGIDCGAVYPYPSGVTKFYPQIVNNVIFDALYPIQMGDTHDGTLVSNNVIRTSSKFAKGQVTWSKNPNAYCFPIPIALLGSRGVTVEKNLIVCEPVDWDATVTVTARNSGTNSFTLSSALAIANNLRPLDSAGNQDYGALVAITAGKYNLYPITGIVGNEVTVDVNYFANQTEFSTGTAYWARSSYEDAHSGAAFTQGAVSAINSTNASIKVDGNIVYGAALDILEQGGTLTLTNNAWFDCKQHWTGANVSRLGQELRDSKLLYNGLEFSKGTGAPSSSADNGSLYIQTDGNPSAALHVRSGGAWYPITNVLGKIKAANTARNSTTTLTADPELVLPAVAAGRYRAELRIDFDDTNTGGFKWDVGGTASLQNSSTVIFGLLSKDSATNWTSFNDPLSGQNLSPWPTARYVVNVTWPVNVLTAGSVALRWAQNTSNAANNTLFSGSYITFTYLGPL